MTIAIARGVTTTHEIISLCQDHLDARAEACCVRGAYEGLAAYPLSCPHPGDECDDCMAEEIARQLATAILECADCGHVYSDLNEDHECRQQREANRRAQR